MLRAAIVTRVKRARASARVGGADAIFGEDEDSTLLGVTTLEALGLSLDPIRRQLRPVPLILAAV